MRFFIHLGCLLALVGICNSSPVTNPSSDSDPLEKRQSQSSFAITGIQGTALRLEVRQLQKNTAQWNLYLLALNDFQNRDQSTQLSYYQISGIHGRPYVPWDGVNFTPGRGGGYCTHSSSLFPVWHRPYLALYEQVLYGLVQQRARTIGTQEYLNAARTFRIPYWDWAAPAAAGQSVLPSSIGGSTTVRITLPSGPQTISNPLYRYHFHPVNTKDIPDSPMSTWAYTLRYPNSQAANAGSQNGLVARQLDQSQASFSKRFMNLLEAYPTYQRFSNKAWIPNSPGAYDSLESLHDQIHGLVGGNGGDMSYVDYSAFDPIFWLHHTNADRLFAIWQAIYPNSFITPNKDLHGTAIIRPGDTVDANTHLTPFHRDTKGTFWTPTTARKTTTFGYNYPETQSGNAAAVKKAVNDLYGKSAGTSLARRSADAPESAPKRQQGYLSGLFARFMAALGVAPKDLPHCNCGKTYTEWVVNIRVAQNAIKQSFFIHIFLGDFTPDPAGWSFDPNLVGTHTVFTDRKVNATDQDPIITGTIPLTPALEKSTYGKPFNLTDDEAIEGYLRKNLHWRSSTMNDVALNLDEVYHLKVSVVSSVVTRAKKSDQFPKWGKFKVHKNITDGRPAGLDKGDAV